MRSLYQDTLGVGREVGVWVGRLTANSSARAIVQLPDAPCFPGAPLPRRQVRQSPGMFHDVTA